MSPLGLDSDQPITSAVVLVHGRCTPEARIWRAVGRILLLRPKEPPRGHPKRHQARDAKSVLAKRAPRCYSLAAMT
jgi:hypothetical protein